MPIPLTPELQEDLRIAVLRAIQASGRIGCAEGHLATAARAAGFVPEHCNSAVDQTYYLLDKGLIALVDKQISPEVRRWRITAAGTDFLASQGF